MSAVQSSIQIAPAPPPAPAGTRFIPLAEAARRSGRVNGHLARLCRDEWLAAGKAELRPPQSGKGKMTWWIREDADPALARVLFPEQIPFDMSAIDKPHRDVILSREKILQEWQASVARAQTADPRLTRLAATLQFCQIAKDLDGHRISPRTLQLWQSAYRAEGRAGLQDDRKHRSRQRDDESDPFLQELKKLYLRLSQPQFATCYRHAKLIADDQGWSVCKPKTAERYIKRLPPQLVIKMRLGETAFANTVTPYVERDYASLTSNQLWCADHHQFDVIVQHEGKHCRPWITAWEDLRSRKIVGYHIFAHDPNQTTILGSFRSACLAHGVPESVYVDNGKDFDCYALQGRTKWERKRIKVTFDDHHVGGVFGALGTAVLHAQPYNAKAKPIERFFNTLKTGFSKMFFATYCGGTTAEKPEDLPDQLARGNAPELADFVAAFATWLEAAYHADAHTGDGMLPGESPAAAWGRCLQVKRTAREEDLELLLERTSRPLKVGRNGVTFNGITYGKADPALDPYFGKEIYLRVGEDLTRASAWTTADKIIAILRSSAKVPFGATDQEYRAAQTQRNRIKNVVKEYQQLGPRRSHDVLQLMAEKRHQDLVAQRPEPTQPPPSIQPIRTPIEGQLDALQNARKQPLALRLAAGGERDVQPPLAPPRRSLLEAAEDFDLAPAAALRTAGGGILSLAERLGD